MHAEYLGKYLGNYSRQSPIPIHCNGPSDNHYKYI